MCDALRALPGISEVAVQYHELRAQAEKGSVAIPIVLSALEAAGITVAPVTVSRPSLDDVYLLYAGREFTKADIAGAAPEQQNQAEESAEGGRGIMMADAALHTWYIAGRHLRNLARQPWYVALTLFQPIL